MQELRAERALEALMHAVAPMARVVRDGVTREIPAADIVRGDVVVLQAGDLVPADLRLTESHMLSDVMFQSQSVNLRPLNEFFRR